MKWWNDQQLCSIIFKKKLTWENGSLALSNDNVIGQNEDLHVIEMLKYKAYFDHLNVICSII